MEHRISTHSWLPLRFLDPVLERTYRRRHGVMAVRREWTGLWIGLVFSSGMLLMQCAGLGEHPDTGWSFLPGVAIPVVLIAVMSCMKANLWTYLRIHDRLLGGALLMTALCFLGIRYLALVQGRDSLSIPALSAALALWLLLVFADLSLGWLALVSLPINFAIFASFYVLDHQHEVSIAFHLVLANVAAFAFRIGLERRDREAYRRHSTLMAARRASEAGQASAVEAMRRKEQLVSFVAHDLRQPLFSLGIHASALALAIERGVTAKIPHGLGAIEDCLACLQAGVGRLSQSATDSILSSLVTATPIDLERVTRAALTVSTGAARIAGVELRLRLGRHAKRARVSSDAPMLVEILGNLIDNGIKYRSGGAAGRRPRVVVGATRLGDGIRIDVVDNGVGIAQSDIARIFEAGWRAGTATVDGSRSGEGLGLASVTDLLRRLPGHRIKVRTRLGHGSRFSLYMTGSDGAGASGAVDGDDVGTHAASDGSSVLREQLPIR
jgi:signal transduction histidine kinase